MPVASEDLLINIEVDAKPAKRGVDDLNASLAENTKQTKAIQKELQRLEKEYKSIATAAKKLPAEEASQLAKSVKKAERATARLSDQFDRTGQKLDKVRDRTVDVTHGFAAASAAIAALSNIENLIKFTDRVNKAAQAVLQFSNNLGPTITGSQELFAKGFERGKLAVQTFSTALGNMSGFIPALKEQVQILFGYQHVAVRSIPIFGQLKDAVGAVASTAKFFERGLVSIRNFFTATSEGVGRLRTLFNTIRAGSVTAMDVLGELGGVFGSTFGTSTGGAARLNVFQRAYLDVQYVIERGSASIVGMFKKISTGLSELVSRGMAPVSAAFKNFNIIEFAKTVEGIAAKGFGAFLKGLIDIGVGGVKLGQNLGILGKGFIGLIDNTAMVGGALVGLGTILKRTDNVILDTIGSLVQLMGVFSISISAALTFATAALGQFFLAAGDKLFALSDIWEEKFTAMQKVTQAFEFTIQGFGKTLGEEAVGGLQFWNAEVEKLTETTAFGAAEIQKSIKVMVAEGAQLGLTADDNAKLLKRAADIAAVTGTDLSEVVLSITRGLQGNAGSLKTLGIFVDDAALQHSHLAQSQGLVVEQMGRQAKAQLAMNVILDQTAPLVGAAADQLNTISGSQKQLSQTSDLLLAKLGSQSVVWAQLTQVKSKFLAALTRLPDGFFDFISAVTDTAAVLFKLTGYFLTTILTIAGLKGAFDTLNLVVGKSKIVKIALNTVINVVRMSLGMQTVAITSLKTAMIAMSQTVIPGLTLAFKNFQATLIAGSKRVYAFVASLFFTQAGWATIVAGASAATGAILKFTTALLANPWTYVVAGVVATAVAIQQLFDELEQFKDKTDEVNGSISKTPGLLEQLAQVAKNVGQVFVDMAKYVIIGWLKIIRVLELSAIGWKKLWAAMTGNSKALQDLEVAQEETVNKLIELDAALSRTFGGGTALAATMGEEVDRLTGKFDKLTTAAQTRFDLGVTGAQVSALGSEFEKAALSIKTAQFELGEVRKEVKKVAETFSPKAAGFLGDNFDPSMVNALIGKLKAAGQETKQLEEVASKFSDAYIKKIGAESSALALRNKIAEDASKTALEARKAELEAAGRSIEKIKLETQEKLRAKQEELKGLALLGQDIAVRREQVEQIKNATKAIKQQEAAQIAAVKAELERKEIEQNEKRAKEIQEELGKIEEYEKLIKGLSKDVSQMNIENLKHRGNVRDLASAEYEFRLQEINAVQKSVEQHEEFWEKGKNGARQLKKQFKDTFDTARAIAKEKYELQIESTTLIYQLNEAFSKLDPKTLAGSVTAAFIQGWGEAANVAHKIWTSAGDWYDKATEFVSNFKVSDIVDLWENADLQTMFVKAGDLLAHGMVGAADLISQLFSVEAISGLADQIKNLAKLPTELMKAFLSLISGMDAIISGFVGAVSRALEMFPRIIQRVLNRLPALFGALVQALGKVLDALPALVARILSQLPDILGKILGMLPDLILKFADAFGKVAAVIIRAAPEFVVQIAEHADEIVEALVEGLVASMGDITVAFVDFLIGGGMEKIVGALIRAMPRVALALVTGFLNGIQKALGTIMGGIKISDQVQDIGKKFDEGVRKLAAKATQEASKLFRVLDIEAAATGLERAKIINDAFNHGMNMLEMKFKGLFDNLVKWWHSFINWLEGVVAKIGMAFQWLADNVIAPLAAIITGAFQWALDNVVIPLINGVIYAFQWVWDNVVNPLINGVIYAFQWVWDNVINTLLQGVVIAFQWVWDNVVNPLINGITDSFKWVDENVVNPLVNGIVDSFKWIDANVVSPLINGLDSIFSWVKDNIIDPLTSFSWPELPGISGGGGGGSGGFIGQVSKSWGIGHTGGMARTLAAATAAIPVQRFASGGMVDSVPALLQPGEFVVRRDSVNALGTQFLNQINKGKVPDSGGTSYNITVNLDATLNRKDDEQYIRSTIIPAIRREFKDASLRGEFVLSKKGLRET